MRQSEILGVAFRFFRLSGVAGVAIKTHWHYAIKDYYLYAVSEAVPKRKISQKQQEVLAAGAALILDTETTGLGDEDEVIQLGIVDLEEWVLFNSLFRPTIEVSPGALAVHGIGGGGCVAGGANF